MRTVCIHIPHFYVQLARLKDPGLCKRPVIIGGRPEENSYVIDCSQELTNLGILPSMPLKEAYQLCGDALFIPFERREYERIWEEILSTLAGVTLRIESREPGTAFLDITRLPGVYKSEDQLAFTVVQLVLSRFRLKAKAGIGNSRFIAFEAAFSPSHDVLSIHPGKEKGFLSPLSVERLPIPVESRERLHLLGLHALGLISAFPLPALTSQFGAIGKVIWGIANGIEEQDRIPCLFPVTDIDQEIVCDTAVFSREQIMATLTILLEKLCMELEDAGMACRTIKLVFDLRNRTFFEKKFVFKSPTAYEEEMLRRIMNGLEQVVLPSPVQIMSVRASALVPYRCRQDKLFKIWPDFSKGLKDVSGFLKTKYGSMPLVRVVENNESTLLPDERFIFVEP